MQNIKIDSQKLPYNGKLLKITEEETEPIQYQNKGECTFIFLEITEEEVTKTTLLLDGFFIV